MGRLAPGQCNHGWQLWQIADNRIVFYCQHCRVVCRYTLWYFVTKYIIERAYEECD